MALFQVFELPISPYMRLDVAPLLGVPAEVDLREDRYSLCLNDSRRPIVSGTATDLRLSFQVDGYFRFCHESYDLKQRVFFGPIMAGIPIAGGEFKKRREDPDSCVLNLISAISPQALPLQCVMAA